MAAAVVRASGHRRRVGVRPAHFPSPRISSAGSAPPPRLPPRPRDKTAPGGGAEVEVGGPSSVGRGTTTWGSRRRQNLSFSSPSTGLLPA